MEIHIKKCFGSNKMLFCEGQCPKCASVDIDWGQLKKQPNEDMVAFQKACCNNCDHPFTEYYNLEYLNTEDEE